MKYFAATLLVVIFSQHAVAASNNIFGKLSPAMVSSMVDMRISSSCHTTTDIDNNPIVTNSVQCSTKLNKIIKALEELPDQQDEILKIMTFKEEHKVP